MEFQKTASQKRRKLVNGNAFAIDYEGSGSSEPSFQFVTAIEGNALNSVAQENDRGPLVIPLATARDSLSLQAEREILDELNGTVAVSDRVIQLGDQNGKRLPSLLATISATMGNASNDDERFQLDVGRRANDVNFRSDTYDRVPIEEFGAALLRGMGWTGSIDNQDIKANRKQDRRDGRLGLGAGMNLPPSSRSGSKQSSGVVSQQSSSSDHSARVSQLSKGVRVRLLDSGRVATVAATTGVPGLNKISVSLVESGEIIHVDRKSVTIIEQDSQPSSSAQRKSESRVSQAESKEPDVPQSSNQSSKYTSQPAAHQSSTSASSSSSQSGSWIRTGIHVKIVSKKVGGSKLNLQKAVVIDVPSPGIATLRTASGEVVEDVKEKYLETVLPAVGNKCIVLRGSLKGEIARLMERERDGSRALVQLDDSLEVQRLELDDIAAIVEYN